MNSSFLEEVAARLLWETTEHMMKGSGIEANDVVAVVLLSNAHELCVIALSNVSSREKFCSCPEMNGLTPRRNLGDPFEKDEVEDKTKAVDLTIGVMMHIFEYALNLCKRADHTATANSLIERENAMRIRIATLAAKAACAV